MADALETGNCTYIPDAMVYKVLMEADEPRARGVLYIDRRTREPREVFGRVVVLCAQALESVRVLFNSATPRFSNGLANSSGELGHYLQDHVWNGGGATGEFPEMAVKPSMGSPRRPNGIYVIRFRNTKTGPKSTQFLRGYGFQGGWGGPDFNWRAPGFGATFKKALLEPGGSLSLGGFGEALSRRENFVELDRNVVDAFGIPVLHIQMTWSENERAMIADMASSAAEMLEAAGARNVRPWTVMDRMPGMGIHEVGIARMGARPETSVLNQFQQTHDIKNLFVMDGAGFTSSACQNPTLTIMALAVRSCDFLLNEMKRGVL
jgi:choline dehydrogenase-like flavoprotein